MARDYASRQLKRNKPDAVDTGRSRGAVPKATEEVAATGTDIWSRLPGWGWLAIGLVAGFLLAQLTRPSAPTPMEARPPVVDQPATLVSKPAASSSSEGTAERPAQPRFDFYTLLPETEVIAPKVEAYQSTPREAEDQPRFMLQVGSFRAAADAARLEERLKTLGFDRIRVNPVETASGDTWHRVQVGPYQDRRLLARAQDDLAKAGFEFMLLRLRDEPVTQPDPTPTAPQ